MGRAGQLRDDGNGTVQRTSKFVWDGMTIAEERNSSNTVVKRFLPEGVQLPGGTSPNSKFYYSRDHLGSIRGLTNESGSVLSTVDYDPYGSISRAPVPDNTTSDGPVLTGAVSRLTHGSAGAFDINLPLSGAPGIEMRSQAGNSGNYTLVLTFDRPVVAATSATIASGVGSVSGVPLFVGNTATVQLSGVADRQTITLELDNVVGVTGTTAKVFVAMSVLVGDVNQNGAVTVEDINAVKSHALVTVDSSTFRYDVNCSGTITSGDTNFTKSSESDGASLFPDFAFTGHYYHARSGLYLTMYRAYNPSLGRWLSRDPIGEKGGINLYRYVGNDAVNASDRLGLYDYSEAQTRKLFLVPAFIYATEGPIRGLFNIADLSVGDYDFGNTIRHSDDTFCVNGHQMNADQFGNYIAGYEGASYDAHVLSPFPATLTVYVYGFLFHITHVTKAKNDVFDSTGFPYITAGLLDAP